MGACGVRLRRVPPPSDRGRTTNHAEDSFAGATNLTLACPWHDNMSPRRRDRGARGGFAECGTALSRIVRTDILNEGPRASEGSPVRHYLSETWFDPRLSVAPSSVHGQGLVAVESFAAGETVMVWGGTAYPEADLGTGAIPRGISYSVVAEGVILAGPEGGMDYFLNHSCDPNVWMADEVTVTARRGSALGRRSSSTTPWRRARSATRCRTVVAVRSIAAARSPGTTGAFQNSASGTVDTSSRSSSAGPRRPGRAGSRRRLARLPSSPGAEPSTWSVQPLACRRVVLVRPGTSDRRYLPGASCLAADCGGSRCDVPHQCYGAGVWYSRCPFVRHLARDAEGSDARHDGHQ